MAYFGRARQGVAAVVLLALLLPAATGCDRLPLQDDLQEGKAALREGDWSRARKLLERYLSTARNPDARWEAWNRLVEASDRIRPGGRWLVDYLEAMLFEFGDSPGRTREILYRLAEEHETAGRFEHAAETWIQLIQTPELPAEESLEAHRRLARIDIMLHRFDAAEEVLESCLELPADAALHARCLYDLADAAASREHFEDAARMARQVMDIDGVTPELRAGAGFILGDVLEQQGKFGEALACFEAIRETYPNELVVDYRITALKKRLKGKE